MHLLLLGIGLFATAFLFHIVLWHVSLPKRHTTTLLFLFGGAYIAGLLILFLSPLHYLIPASFCDLLILTIFYLALSLSYVCFYSIVEEDSPSLEIVRIVHEAGNAGVERVALDAYFQTGNIVNARLRAGVNGGLFSKSDGNYVLTAKGRLFAEVFAATAKLLTLEKGG
jgi:uncharacterized membrane protein